MKWEEKRYTPQELQRMQQEAVERVRQMQRRSEQAIRHSPRAPSFFVQDSPPKETQQQRQPELPPQEPVQQPQPTPFSCAAAGAKATAATSIPGTAFCQRVWSF